MSAGTNFYENRAIFLLNGKPLTDQLNISSVTWTLDENVGYVDGMSADQTPSGFVKKNKRTSFQVNFKIPVEGIALGLFDIDYAGQNVQCQVFGSSTLYQTVYQGKTLLFNKCVFQGYAGGSGFSGVDREGELVCNFLALKGTEVN